MVLTDLYTQKPRLKRTAFWVLVYALLAVGLGGYAMALFFVIAPAILSPQFVENLDNFTKFSFMFFYNLIHIGLYLSFAYLLVGSLLILNNKRWAKTVVRFGVWPSLVLAIAIVVLTFVYGVLGLELLSCVINYIIGFIIFTFAFIILHALQKYR